MSIFSECRAVVLLADYAVADSGGKLNILGAGFTITAVQPTTGLTAAQYVVVMVDVPPRYVGEDFPLGVELRDEATGQTVVMPGPTGNPDALRVQQLVRAEPPQIAGVYLPTSLWSRVQLVLAFPNGLPLQPGGEYHWRVEVEAQHRQGWSAHFLVAGPPPPPVFGGPAGNQDIQDVPPVE
ncbi:hypothetical protein OG558_12750 [Kribbella sp. NBC_01510]|uniref:DUF6941 family protein n=1 Tax=Kribbella sp. NBC_01510 TaxID=2903581 RepID=UPI00386ABBA3